MLISTIPGRRGQRYLETLLYGRRSRGLGDDAPYITDFPSASLPGVVPYLPPPIPPQSTLPPIWSPVKVGATPPFIPAPSMPINIGGGIVYVPPPPSTVPAVPGQMVPVAGGKTAPAVAGQAAATPGFTLNAQGELVPTTAGGSLTAWLGGSMIPGVTNKTLLLAGGGLWVASVLISGFKVKRRK